MNFYSLKFGLSVGSNQASLIELLKSNQAEVIQTSDGLCVKSGLDESDFKKLVESKVGGVSVTILDPAQVTQDAHASIDLKAFVSR